MCQCCVAVRSHPTRPPGAVEPSVEWPTRDARFPIVGPWRMRARAARGRNASPEHTNQSSGAASD
eukprot:5944041-Lingulodinium_polyedra.AAC.1